MLEETTLDVTMLPQPDWVTCGPTALHAVYSFYGDDCSLDTLLAEVGMLEEGGTLAVMLATHALRRGYAATLYTFNLRLFDPTWFRGDVDIAAKLGTQARIKSDNSKLLVASAAYARFVELGGNLRMEDLTPRLIHNHILAGRPVLAGTSATYLMGCARELDDGTFDDVRGAPQGHFVLATGFRQDEVLVTDPWPEGGRAARYWVSIERFITAALLGVLTYDGNLLVLERKR